MHRIGVAVWTATALTISLGALRADAAGIYEDASAESVLLLSADRVTVWGTLEGTSGEVEGWVYRLRAAFPIRSFMVAIDQPFVAVTDSSEIETGVGDLGVRARARLWHGSGRAVYLLGYLGTGTGDERFFPYSSRTVDVNASAAYADSLGPVTAWLMAGLTRVGNAPPDSIVTSQHVNHARASAGLSWDVGSRLCVGAGGLFLSYKNDARRDLVFGTVLYRWTDALGLMGEVQFETGPVGDRVEDWSAIGGLRVQF